MSPLTQKVVALAAKVKKLEEDKDHLAVNLNRAEEEVCELVKITRHVHGLVFKFSGENQAFVFSG